MEQKRTILHLINSLGRGGAEKLLRDSVGLLDDYNHIICYLNPPDDFKEDLSGHTVICLHYKGRIKAWTTVRRIRSLIRSYKVDLVHTHLLESTWLGRLACPRAIPFAATLHSTLSKDAFYINRKSLWFERATISPRQHIIAVSQVVLDDYLQHVPFKGRTFVLHNLVAPVFFDQPKQSYWTKGNPLKLVTVGNLKEAKNYPFILETFRQLKDLPVSLDIYGSGHLQAPLQSYIDQEGLPVRLITDGAIISDVLMQYDLYLVASLHEGFGIAPLEAMAKGLPVLASDIPVFHEVMGDAAVYFNIADSAQLVSFLRNILAGTMELGAWGHKSRSRAQDIASADHYAEKLKAIYKTILLSD